MTERYFTKFPTFVYDGKVCRDITRRVTITQKSKNNVNNFYPFMLRDEIRSDQVADFYYNDPEADWLVYHTNKIIDPYYDWYNTNETFNLLLIEKYGSIENAMKKVWLYCNNWEEDDSAITVSTYENQLVESWKKYYNPIWGPKAEVIGYERKKIDFYQNTNRVIQYNSISGTSNSFIIGELVDIKYGGQFIGGGEVIWSNNTVLTIKNVYGNTFANSSITPSIISEATSANVVVDGFDIIKESIPLSEERFWSPIYYYDYEMIKNESKKHIDLINNGVAPFVIQDFESKLQE